MLIDLRSDTVTRPTKQMLEAMMNAPVGDDVFGEDSSINALQEKAAALFNMEAGLFCPSGTMTNQIAIKVHTKPGDEVICDATAHIFNFEGGGIGFNSGAQARLIQGINGKIKPAQVLENINADFDWLARTSLVSIENTANRAGGGCYTFDEMQALSGIARSKGLKYHLDGARIFNAVVKKKMDTKKIGPLFDSISVCLSKGLGTPVGSVLLGPKDFIKEAKRMRKVMGGGMRQAGIIAAAGIYALDNHVERLEEDHEKAATLAETLKDLSFVESIAPVETNIVIFNLKNDWTAEKLSSELKKSNIILSPFGAKTVRIVTHLDFTDEMLKKTIEALKQLN
jgi:threonine aldolase